MNLPFSGDQFLSVFEDYNQTVWPAQIILILAGFTTVWFSLKPARRSDRLISCLLSALWLWTGIMYHLAFFTKINPAAYLFGGAVILQGLLFIYYGLISHRLSFRFTPDIYGFTGAVFISYSMVLYPLLGYFLWHVYPEAPTFGLPCPTTLFTFGLMFWTTLRMPWIVLVIPFLWSVIGFSAAVTLGMYEDTGLLVAGGTGLILLLLKNPHPTTEGTIQ